MTACAGRGPAPERVARTARLRATVSPCAWALLAAACSSPGAVEPTPLPAVPTRAPTAGDELLALAPAGADMVLELDLARLRRNAVSGPVLARLADLEQSARPALPRLDALDALGSLSTGIFSELDAVLLVAYHVGEKRAVTITLARGQKPLGTDLGAGLSVLGPPQWVARVRAVQRGDAGALSADRPLMTLRTRAMPAKAEGGFLRAAGRFDFEAQVELASRLDLDRVPRAISVWADIADDFAIVSHLQGAEPGAGRALADALGRLRDRLAQLPWIRRRYLHFTLRGADISASGANARMTLVIGPTRLQRMMARLLKSLGAHTGAARATEQPPL